VPSREARLPGFPAQPGSLFSNFCAILNREFLIFAIFLIFYFNFPALIISSFSFGLTLLWNWLRGVLFGDPGAQAPLNVGSVQPRRPIHSV
jgi:hypothetical protein